MLFSFSQALEDYNEAVKLSQAKYRPLFNRGNCLRKMGRVNESIADLKQVRFQATRAHGAGKRVSLRVLA